MELRYINSFLKIASFQNFSKAAEYMGYSQSTLTVQIQQLEKELGVRLFDRIGRKVYLTGKGELFLEYAIEITRLANDAITSMKHDEVISGTLRIGCIESIGTSILTDLLLKYHHKFPQVNTLIKASTSDGLLLMLKNNELDIICTLDHNLYGSEWVKRFQNEESIVFVSSTNLGDARLSLQELTNFPFLLTEKGESYRYHLENILAENNLEVKPVLESGNTETLIKMVEKGMGISFLPLYTIEKKLSEEKVFIMNIDVEPINMWCQLIHHKNKLLTPQIIEFINIFEDWYVNRKYNSMIPKQSTVKIHVMP